MKRIRTMTKPPPGLSSYLGQAAEPRYEEFRSYEGGAAYKELITDLVALQRGLCGYCEIELTDLDRQIEHVAPQSRHPDRVLDTTNMMACCKGGSSPSEDEERAGGGMALPQWAVDEAAEQPAKPWRYPEPAVAAAAGLTARLWAKMPSCATERP